MTFDGAGRRASTGSASTDAATGTAGSGARSRTGQRYAVQRRAAVAGAEPAAAGHGRLLVDDGPLGPGQMLRADFLEQTSTVLRHATQQDLGPLAALGSPYLDQVLARLHAPGGDLEATLAELVPGAHDVDAATALIPMVVQHVRAESRARDTGQRAEGPARVADDATAASAEREEYRALPQLTPEARAVADELERLVDGAKPEQVLAPVRERENTEVRSRAKQRRAGVMPELTGVGSTIAIDAVAGQILSVQGEWPGLDAQGKRDRVKDAANGVLASADVPPILGAIESTRKSRAAFHYPSWHLLVSRKVTDQQTLPDEEARGLAVTTAHEARHAEQYFLAARFSAESGATATQIREKHNLPVAVAELAVKKKLTGAPADVVDLAARMKQEVVDEFADNAKTNSAYGYDELDERKREAYLALTDLRGRPTPETLAAARAACHALRTQMAAVERMYLAYREMGHEADAHEVGESAGAAFDAQVVAPTTDD